MKSISNVDYYKNNHIYKRYAYSEDGLNAFHDGDSLGDWM